MFNFLDFDSALKKREHEFRTQVDEMSAKVLEFDLKVLYCNINTFIFNYFM